MQSELVGSQGYPQEKVHVYRTVDAGLQSVGDGISQAFIIDEAAAREHADGSSGTLKVATMISDYSVQYGCAMNLGSQDLKTIVDRVITTTIANGEMDELKEKWGVC